MRMKVLFRMKTVGVFVLMLCLHRMFFCSAQQHQGLPFAPSSSRPQQCASTQELVNSLRQVEKMLAINEASFQQGLRALRKKMSVLQNSTMAIVQNSASCPKPEAPVNGRRLGRVFGIGHEIHFLCKPGFELIGPRTRVCLTSGRWSGQQPICRRLNNNNTGGSLASYSLAGPSSYSSSSSFPASAALSAASSSSASSPSPLNSLSPTSSPASVRPSHCTHFLGSTRCTCDVGFTISGRDNNICTDIDECHLFPLAQSGRLCVHQCENTPGSFHCFCPIGYDLARDGRSCTDIDECQNRMHTCTAEQVCVNTYGGFQCVTVECPNMNNATYIKTSPIDAGRTVLRWGGSQGGSSTACRVNVSRCERNPCMLGDRGCALAPNSISFHFLSVVSNMSAPRVLFRVSAARILGDTLRFGLAGDRGRGHFSVQRSGRQTGTLLLVTPIQGPATLEAEVEMSELERNSLLGRYLTKVTLFVSPYEF